MLVRTRNGKPLEISVYVQYADDLQIGSATYVNAPQLEVPISVIEYVEGTYASEIYMEWSEDRISDAEYRYGGER